MSTKGKQNERTSNSGGRLGVTALLLARGRVGRTAVYSRFVYAECARALRFGRLHSCADGFVPASDASLSRKIAGGIGGRLPAGQSHRLAGSLEYNGCVKHRGAGDVVRSAE